MEIRIKLDTVAAQGAKMDLDAIAKAEHSTLNALVVEAMQDCVNKHRLAMVKEICAAVKVRSNTIQKFADNSVDYKYTVAGIEITATFRRGHEPYFVASELDAPGLPRFYKDKNLGDVIDLYKLL